MQIIGIVEENNLEPKKKEYDKQQNGRVSEDNCTLLPRNSTERKKNTKDEY